MPRPRGSIRHRQHLHHRMPHRRRRSALEGAARRALGGRGAVAAVCADGCGESCVVVALPCDHLGDWVESRVRHDPLAARASDYIRLVGKGRREDARSREWPCGLVGGDVDDLRVGFPGVDAASDTSDRQSFRGSFRMPRKCGGAHPCIISLAQPCHLPLALSKRMGLPHVDTFSPAVLTSR